MIPNHPNRSQVGSLARNPTPEDVRAAREATGITQSVAAALVHTSIRSWQQWEPPVGDRNHRRMHPGLWELFRIKIAS